MINRYLITNVNFLGSSGMQNFDLTYNISGGGGPTKSCTSVIGTVKVECHTKF